MNRFLMVLTVCLLLPGCASLVSNSAWPVFIDNTSGPADFVIKNKNDVEISRGQTPAIIILESGAGYFRRADYTVHFSKRGYRDQGYRLSAFINGWYYGNFSNILGFLIDPATGAMWRLTQQLIVSMPVLPPSPPLNMPIEDQPEQSPVKTYHLTPRL